MPRELTYKLAQINPTLGAMTSNGDKILEIWRSSDACDLVIFPELCLCGYPPEDLVLKPAFLGAIENEIERLCHESETFQAAALIGCPWYEDGITYNSVHLIEKGRIVATQHKHHLPNYGVFDEKRVFSAGPVPQCIDFRDHKLGIMICEDMWVEKNIPKTLKDEGADILISINASPFTAKKHNIRAHIAKEHALENQLPLIYLNQVGGQDELVFDGGSFMLDDKGEFLAQLPFFEEGTYDTQNIEKFVSLPEEDTSRQIYNALKLGLHDYVGKNGFPHVLIGLSGGIDSALVAAIACDTLGPDRVHCVMMPSPFTSQDSLKDAKALAENLGCRYDIITIKEVMDAFERTLPDLAGTAHENMQSRCRGLILMALSNQNGALLLSTGNKSEMAVGYATLYGDMNGGFNVLKDIYKTNVYKLCRWRNQQSQPIIPERILTKAPSAELKDNQTDQDSLPDYDVLDAILECLIEKEMGLEEIISEGHDANVAHKIWKMLDIAEYKRRQAPPGIVITDKAFGRDRRYPITNHFLKYIEKSRA